MVLDTKAHQNNYKDICVTVMDSMSMKSDSGTQTTLSSVDFDKTCDKEGLKNLIYKALQNYMTLLRYDRSSFNYSVSLCKYVKKEFKNIKQKAYYEDEANLFPGHWQ